MIVINDNDSDGIPLQYTQHMTWTALGLLGVNILAGGTTVIIRHMKRVHWATQVSHNC